VGFAGASGIGVARAAGVVIAGAGDAGALVALFIPIEWDDDVMA
jgi:hypothetical protein